MGVDSFWAEVLKFITFDENAVPGRYLGRDHLIVELGYGRQDSMSMADYTLSAVDMYESEFGVIKEQETRFLSESALTSEGFSEKDHLADSAASLLLKLLWLARLSRQDSSFCMVSLAEAVTGWSPSHDLQLKRFIGYVKRTHDLDGEKCLSFENSILGTFTVIRIWQGTVKAIQEYLFV